GPSVQPQAVERLWARDLVHEVEIDEQEVRLAVPPAHHVLFPDLLGERLRLPLRHEVDLPGKSAQGVPYNGTASRYLGQGGYQPVADGSDVSTGSSDDRASLASRWALRARDHERIAGRRPADAEPAPDTPV